MSKLPQQQVPSYIDSLTVGRLRVENLAVGGADAVAAVGTGLLGNGTCLIPGAVNSVGVTDHSQLTGIGTNDHAEIDAFIAAFNASTPVTDHTQLTSIGVNTHPQIDNFMASRANNNGLATLDGTGNVPLSQLGNIPSSTYTPTQVELSHNVPFTVPAGVTMLRVVAVGGGGGGAAAQDVGIVGGQFKDGGGGGGSGATTFVELAGYFSGTTLTAQIGLGGEGGWFGNAPGGTDGDTTTVSINGRTLMTAQGGKGAVSSSGGNGGTHDGNGWSCGGGGGGKAQGAGGGDSLGGTGSYPGEPGTTWDGTEFNGGRGGLAGNGGPINSGSGGGGGGGGVGGGRGFDYIDGFNFGGGNGSGPGAGGGGSNGGVYATPRGGHGASGAVKVYMY